MGVQEKVQLPLLFYPPGFVNESKLRSLARQRMEESELILACHRADREAIIAFTLGFWSFVQNFGEAIDGYLFDFRALEATFGAGVVRGKLRGLRKHLKVMAGEERNHAEQWRLDALAIGIEIPERPFVVPCMGYLNQMTQVKVIHWCCAALAGVEYIAEELARFLHESKAFRSLFPEGYWKWGSFHRVPGEGEHEITHRQIDEDLARAFYVAERRRTTDTHDDNHVREVIESAIKAIILLFGAAADDVLAHKELFVAQATEPRDRRLAY